ncbi:MAG: ABC transporter permease [Candidatus Korobacteraceae bacterium]
MRRPRLEAEMETELRFHLESHADDLVRTGIPRQEAMRKARLEFGNFESHKDSMRASLGLRLWDELWGDLRYALRRMRRSPGFTAVAVLALALGTGANTALFSLINTLMLRTLPVRDPRQLVAVMHRFPGEPALEGFSWPAYQLMRDHNHVLSGLTAAINQRFQMPAEKLEPQTVDGAYVDGNFFALLGVEPALGRLIASDDDQADNPSEVAVISWSYWKSRFNLDPKILGKQIVIDNAQVTIVGVAARGFSGLQIENPQNLWLPLTMRPSVTRSGLERPPLSLVGRLKSGVSIDLAQAELAVLYRSTLEEQAAATKNPFVRKVKLELLPAGEGLSRLREQWSKPLLALIAVAGLLLLIACTSLAMVLLARGAAREHEMAQRMSLGAGRLRLMRQLLTESLAMSAIGSLLGVFLAYFGVQVLVRMISAVRRPGPPVELHIHPDWRLLMATVAVALLTGLLLGVVPALRAMATAPAPALKHTGNAGETRFGRLSGPGLVVAQVAMSVVLLSAANLFVGYCANLEHAELGFRRDHVLLVTLDTAHSGYDDRQLLRLYQELLTRLEAIPGVRSASICAVSPIQGAGANRGVTVEGYAARPGEIRNVMENWIGPKYFQTLGTPIVAGRDFTFADTGRVAIINQTMARRYFGGHDPLGRQIVFDGDKQPYHIVGVAGDAKYLALREATYPTMYLNTFQEHEAVSQFALRTSIDPEAVLPDVRREVSDLLKTVTISRATTLNDQVDASIVPERLMATASGWFGALGALLAAIGLYGLLAYTVARRSNEIGIRMALGASRGRVMRMVLSGALTTVCIGLAIGGVAAFWAGHFAASLIADLPAKSAAPIAFGAIAMTMIAALAACGPAYRASHVDPMEALRYE